jgi:hypothetical protein
MDKTTMYLDGVAYRKLKRIATVVGRPPAALVREAVAEYVARHAVRGLPRSIGAFGSRRPDLGHRAEDLLADFGESGRTAPRTVQARAPRSPRRSRRS